MTVQELLNALKDKNPDAVVCVETRLGKGRWEKYPLDDRTFSHARVKRNGEFYNTISLMLGDWP